MSDVFKTDQGFYASYEEAMYHAVSEDEIVPLTYAEYYDFVEVRFNELKTEYGDYFEFSPWGNETTYIRFFGYGDYSGSLVEKSNQNLFRKFLDENEIEYVVRTLGYGYCAIELSAVTLALLNNYEWAELIDLLSSYVNYTVLDDSHYSELEHETRIESYNISVVEDALKAANLPYEYVLDGTELEEWVSALEALYCEYDNGSSHSEPYGWYWGWSWMSKLNKGQLSEVRKLVAKDILAERARYREYKEQQTRKAQENLSRHTDWIKANVPMIVPKKGITFIQTNQGYAGVLCVKYGIWAVHSAYNASGYTVTHSPSGLSAGTFSREFDACQCAMWLDYAFHDTPRKNLEPNEALKTLLRDWRNNALGSNSDLYPVV